MQLHHISLFSFLYKIAVQAQLLCNGICWVVGREGGKGGKEQLCLYSKGGKNQLSTTQELKVLQQLIPLSPHRRDAASCSI